MNRRYGEYEVSVRDEPTYSRNSTDNVRSYKYEYCRSDEYEHVSAHGVVVGDLESPDSSAILLGVGGATGINENSLTHNGNTLYVAAGDAVFALVLPSLDLKWSKKVDFATCFGVYWLQDKRRLITWGEVNVSCFNEDGAEMWSASGPDIFTEDFEIEGSHIKLTDFNNDIFQINIETGALSRGNT